MGSCDNRRRPQHIGYKVRTLYGASESKTNKLVILSPVPCGYHQSYDEIKSLVKALLADEIKPMRSMTSALTKNQYASTPTLR